MMLKLKTILISIELALCGMFLVSCESLPLLNRLHTKDQLSFATNEVTSVTTAIPPKELPRIISGHYVNPVTGEYLVLDINTYSNIAKVVLEDCETGNKCIDIDNISINGYRDQLCAGIAGSSDWIITLRGSNKINKRQEGVRLELRKGRVVLQRINVPDPSPKIAMSKIVRDRLPMVVTGCYTNSDSGRKLIIIVKTYSNLANVSIEDTETKERFVEMNNIPVGPFRTQLCDGITGSASFGVKFNWLNSVQNRRESLLLEFKPDNVNCQRLNVPYQTPGMKMTKIL